MARAGERCVRALNRDLAEPVTINLDATAVEVFGAGKAGAGRNRSSGPLAYCCPYAAF